MEITIDSDELLENLDYFITLVKIIKQSINKEDYVKVAFSMGMLCSNIIELQNKFSIEEEDEKENNCEKESMFLNECIMWRKRFIENENNNKIKRRFMSIPTDYYENKTPEQILKEIKEQND